MAAVPAERTGSGFAVLIAGTATAAGVAFVLAFGSLADSVVDSPLHFLAFLGLTLALQALSMEVVGGGRVGVSGVGMLAAGFALGIGAGMAIGAASALIQWLRTRRHPDRVLFDAAQFTLATAAATLVYEAGAALSHGRIGQVAGAGLASVVYVLANTGLVCVAIGLLESRPVHEIWHDRFRWARYHVLSLGPLAFACTLAYETIGVAGLVAFALPPALVLVSVREYVRRTRESAEELRHMNEELASRNQDLEELLAFGSGLAERALDREALVDFAEAAVARLADGPAIVVRDAETAGEPLLAGGERLGALVVPRMSERWDRLGKMIVPQLATALESADLLERVRRTHLATIAALSRSMEAKDATTGNHTERVAELAVGIARSLGFAGDDLEAIEVGALLHDIGKVGIPERILEKPGPLDDEEWAIMRRHPVISDYILSEIDLHPAVRAIARWSHERIDGAGYPDGLAGDEIPVPARIVLVADAFDALTSDRPYRAARGVDEALAELRAHTGTQFAPEVVEALESLLAPPLREAVGV